MRTIKNPIKLIDSMMTENDRLLFNIFYLIAESDSPLWLTDDKSYIIGQTNERLPMWIWTADNAGADVLSEVSGIIRRHLNLKTPLKITAKKEITEKILENFSAEKIEYKLSTPMVTYYCDRMAEEKKTRGRIILSSERHKSVLEKFITGMVYDLEKRPMAEGEAEGFAGAVAGSQDLFLCEDDGVVVSMAMIAHRTEKYARINTVYTDPDYRGKGYAGALMAEITQRILAEGRIPMLYTETDNISSNALYRKSGYKVCGELEEYLVYC